MATPTTGSLNVIGSSGGMAPFPTSVYADPDEAGSTWATGSGVWSEGRWAFQLIDNATGQVYDSGLMDLQCPNSSVTATAYNRYGSAPIAGCVVFDPGTYYWRVKYQNRDGDWSAWANSATFTVAANTRTKLYVDGNAADDSGNGLTPATAKKTLNAALALINGDDFEVILKDDTSIDVTVGVDLTSRSGVWIHRSGDGTNKPVVVCAHSSGEECVLYTGSDMIIDGIEFAYDNVALRYTLFLGGGTSNVGWLNIDTGYLLSFAENPSGTVHEGLVIYGCVMLDRIRRYMLFGGEKAINILGCTWDKGSEIEHLVRIGYAVTSEPVAQEFCSIDFTILDQANRSKTNLRTYIKRFFGAYRCDFRRGTLSCGDIDFTSAAFDTTSSDVPIEPTERFDNYRFDCCRCYMESASAHPQVWVIHECIRNLTIASCHIYQTNGDCVWVNWRSRGDDDPVEGLRFIGCSLFNDGSQASTVFYTTALSNENLVDHQFRGCLLMSTTENIEHHYIQIMLMSNGIPNNSVADPLFLSENVFWQRTFASAPPNDLSDLVDDKLLNVAYKDISVLNSETWASGNIQENLSIDATTAEPSGATTNWQTSFTDITGLFESINGEVFDRTDTTWAAGAWQPVGSGTGGVAGYPTEDLPEPTTTSYLGLSAGGSYIVLQT